MKLAIVPSYRTQRSEFNAFAKSAMTLAKIDAGAIEAVHILGDNVPLARDWAAEPSRAPKTVIETVWPRENNAVRSAADAAKTRNEAMLTGVDTVFVFGKIATKSAQATMSRVFGSPRFHVVQVIDGSAKIVGASTIECDPGYEIRAAKPEAALDASYTDPFAVDAGAPKAKAKRK